jgi:hypothetical protein
MFGNRGVRQQRFIIKNNIIAVAGDGRNFAVDYAPQKSVADVNVYDARAGFRWSEPKHWLSMSFDEWKAATGQDVNSRTGAPEFVNAAAGVLHLHRSDTVGRAIGVDPTGITQVDFDGEPRNAARSVAGADVPAE